MSSIVNQGFKFFKTIVPIEKSREGKNLFILYNCELLENIPKLLAEQNLVVCSFLDKKIKIGIPQRLEAMVKDIAGIVCRGEESHQNQVVLRWQHQFFVITPSMHEKILKEHEAMNPKLTGSCACVIQ